MPQGVDLSPTFPRACPTLCQSCSQLPDTIEVSNGGAELHPGAVGPGGGATGAPGLFVHGEWGLQGLPFRRCCFPREGPASAVWAASSCTLPQPNTDILWCWGKAPVRLVGRETLRDACRNLCLRRCPGTAAGEAAEASRRSWGWTCPLPP